MYLYTRIPAVYFCCCSVLLHCCVAATAVLLLAAADRHRVPDGKVQSLWLWSIESDSSVLSLHSNTICFYVPLGSAVAFTASICLLQCTLGNYGHARSQGGRQPAAAKLPLYLYR